jgi:hypothetical protein
MPQVFQYWVFIDKPTKKAKLHLATCGACQNGRGMHGYHRAQCWWRGFPAKAQAWDYALAEAHTMRSNPTLCGLCKP